MNIVKQMLQLSAKQKLQLTKEGVEYIASIIPPVVSHISPDTPPEVAVIFATNLKLTCFKIIDKASEFMDEDADIRDIDVDWRANYFDKCRTVHDDHMQSLWAKILAGEANNSGTYSKRCVNFVADLDKREAQLFTELCRYVCEIKYTTENVEKIELVPLILDKYLHGHLLYGSSSPKYHIRMADLDHLDNIGMIRIADSKDGVRKTLFDSQVPIEVNYYDESIRLARSSLLSTGKVVLTQNGKELYPICGSTPVDGFFSHICRWEWFDSIKELDEAKAKEIKSTFETWEREPLV